MTARRLAVASATALVLSACTSGGPAATVGAPTPGAGPTSSTTVIPTLIAAVPLELNIATAAFRLATPVQRAVAVTHGSVVYIAGGLDSSGTSVSGVFALDPSSGSLSGLGTVPHPFHDAAAAMVGRSLFIFGGGAAAGTDLVQAFDVATRSGAVVGHLPVALSDLSAATVGDTVYLVGGYDGHAPQTAIYATVDGRRFRVAGQLPVGLRYASLTAVGTTLVVAGGQDRTGPTSQVYTFDTTNGTVATLGHLGSPVAHAAAFSLGGIAYLAGGQDASGAAVDSVVAIDPRTGEVTMRAPLPNPVSDAAVASSADGAILIGGWNGSAVNSVLQATLTPGGSVSPTAATPTDPTSVRPFAGLLLIADRGNNRLLVLNPRGHVVWRYPAPDLPAPRVPFYFPDDAFWVHGGHAILVNEEENNVLAEISYPSGKTLWTYGHPRAPGSSPGYLHQPDDVYPYPGGGVVVADASNCRILFFHPDGTPSRQIGTTGTCTHGLPTSVGYPNGDTPLPNGNLLLSEINGGYVDEVTATGRVVWSVRVPGLYVPSDPQPLPDGTYLAADYTSPGAVVRFTRAGKVLWEYRPTRGPGMLDHPSLAAPLPNGLIAVNDDYNHRVVLIDPKTDRIVWQYGVTNVSGSSGGRLSYPDGLDLLLPGNIVPLHVDFPNDAVHQGRP